MAMVSSLFTAISGMRNHQTLLDVIANNVANVNTVGFKSGRVMFRDLLSQTVSSAVGSDPLSNRGGINPVQLGLGSSVASIDTVHTQGTLQITGNATDMAINGDGFFMVQQGAQVLYTRAGSFSMDSAGRLVDANGGLVQGWSAEAPTRLDGSVDSLAKPAVNSGDISRIDNITIHSGQTMQAKETKVVDLAGSLDAGATYANLGNSAGLDGTTQIRVYDDSDIQYDYIIGDYTRNFYVHDSLGNQHEMSITFQNLSGTQIPDAATGSVYENNTWAWTVNTDPNDKSVHLALDGTVFLDPNNTSETVRASSSGLIKFGTNGALEWVSYGNRNCEHFGTNDNDPTLNNPGDNIANDPNIPGGNDLNIGGGTDLWVEWADTDTFDGSTIGFEGRIIARDPATMAEYETDEIRSGDYSLGSWDSTADAIAVGANDGYDNPAPFSLEKLPIVLVFQNVTDPTALPPSGTTAGTRVEACEIDGTAMVDAVTAEPVMGINVAGMGTVPADAQIQDWYVQWFDIDFGTVSTVERADFDRSDSGVGPEPADLAEAAAPAAENDGAHAGEDSTVTLATNVDNGHEFPWDPRVITRSDGLRDGVVQDTTGEWQLINGLNTYVPNFTVTMREEDGYNQGTLQSVQVTPDGSIVGAFTNGETMDLAQVALASFDNPAGMSKVGDVHYVSTANSGVANIGTALTGARGSVIGGALEQSNVDLAKELTDMIVAQRGFEVNARLISSSDRILDTLVNLGR
jgi:flagellar hook protein FlgE